MSELKWSLRSRRALVAVKVLLADDLGFHGLRETFREPRSERSLALASLAMLSIAEFHEGPLDRNEVTCDDGVLDRIVRMVGGVLVDHGQADALLLAAARRSASEFLACTPYVDTMLSVVQDMTCDRPDSDNQGR